MGEAIRGQMEAGEAPPRRQFFTFLWMGMGLLAVAELVWVALSFLRPGRKAVPGVEPGALFEAGRVEAFAPGTVTAFPRGRFYLSRLDDGGFVALSRRCPHLGCTLPWVDAEKQFVCPCHSSAFDMKGELIRSPAPRGMDLYPVTIENAVVRVDTGRATRRDRPGALAVAYPTST